MGACVLNGLASGPAEVFIPFNQPYIIGLIVRQTIQPNVIADVMFLHERGTYQTLYFAFYFGALMVCITTIYAGRGS